MTSASRYNLEMALDNVNLNNKKCLDDDKILNNQVKFGAMEEKDIRNTTYSSKLFEEIVNSYQSRIFNVVNKILKDDDASNDIVQDVFITLYEKGETFESRSSIYTWLYRIATNKSIDYIRKISRENKHKKSLFHIDNVREKSHDDNIHNRLIIAQALDALDETFRQPLILAEYENMSYAQISEELNIEVNTVRTRIFRARKKMLSILKKYGVKL